MCKNFVPYCIFNLQGANGGVASRRKPAKSWNTMVNEEAEKCGDNAAEKSTMD